MSTGTPLVVNTGPVRECNQALVVAPMYRQTFAVAIAMDVLSFVIGIIAVLMKDIGIFGPLYTKYWKQGELTRKIMGLVYLAVMIALIIADSIAYSAGDGTAQRTRPNIAIFGLVIAIVYMFVFIFSILMTEAPLWRNGTKNMLVILFLFGLLTTDVVIHGLLTDQNSQFACGAL